MAILDPRRIELPFTFQGHELVMVFDTMTIVRFEEATGLSMIEVAADMQPLTEEQIAAGHRPKPPPKLSVMAHMLLAALGARHPEAELSDALTMIVDPEVQALFGKGFAASLPQPGDTGADAEGNAPNRKARRAAAKPRSGGKTGS